MVVREGLADKKNVEQIPEGKVRSKLFDTWGKGIPEGRRSWGWRIQCSRSSRNLVGLEQGGGGRRKATCSEKHHGRELEGSYSYSMGFDLSAV